MKLAELVVIVVSVIIGLTLLIGAVWKLSDLNPTNSATERLGVSNTTLAYVDNNLSEVEFPDHLALTCFVDRCNIEGYRPKLIRLYDQNESLIWEAGRTCGIGWYNDEGTLRQGSTLNVTFYYSGRMLLANESLIVQICFGPQDDYDLFSPDIYECVLPFTVQTYTKIVVINDCITSWERVR